MSIRRPESPIFDQASDPIFCATCLHNQHIVTEALAQYFPAPTNESFDEYERAFPSFKARLEESYPQCCYDCEPRVRQRLKHANYAAKTDNMRRIMDRTRLHERAGIWGSIWSRALIMIGGLLWALAWIQQIIWNLGSLTLLNSSHWKASSAAPTTGAALHSLIFDRKLPSNVDSLIFSNGSWSVILGLLSLWWHPCLQQKVSRKRSEIEGLGEFYKLQVLAFTVRCVIWYLMSTHQIGGEAERALHTFMLIFCLPVGPLDL